MKQLLSSVMYVRLSVGPFPVSYWVSSASVLRTLCHPLQPFHVRVIRVLWKSWQLNRYAGLFDSSRRSDSFYYKWSTRSFPSLIWPGKTAIPHFRKTASWPNPGSGWVNCQSQSATLLCSPLILHWTDGLRRSFPTNKYTIEQRLSHRDVVFRINNQKRWRNCNPYLLCESRPGSRRSNNRRGA